MKTEKNIFHGATVEMIKDAGTITRHAYVKVNGNDVFHIIENKQGNLNLFRYDIPHMRICELMTSYDMLNVNSITGFIRKRDIEL